MCNSPCPDYSSDFSQNALFWETLLCVGSNRTFQSDDLEISSEQCFSINTTPKLTHDNLLLRTIIQKCSKIGFPSSVFQHLSHRREGDSVVSNRDSEQFSLKRTQGHTFLSFRMLSWIYQTSTQNVGKRVQQTGPRAGVIGATNSTSKEQQLHVLIVSCLLTRRQHCIFLELL